MKKLLFSFVAMATVMAMSGMNAFAASVNTDLVRDTSGGAAPVVLAKWEASIDFVHDDDPAAGAQLMPTGVYDGNKTISICAVVMDADGLADIDRVFADVFYPEGIELGDSHRPLPDQSGLGCGEFMQEDELFVMDKAAGIERFCGQTGVRVENNNVVSFPGGVDNYDQICGDTGHLWKDTAKVYCGQKDLSYEDPNGDYEVWAVAQDANGLQGILSNDMTYLPLTAFETDFNQIRYGPVRLNTHKIIPGDKTWDALNTGPASVRNVGNTRLGMQVWQDDMGLGKTDGIWNVKYDARVGSQAQYAIYDPEVTTLLDDELDLSELDEMDFSIDISKFPPTNTSGIFTGSMTLSALQKDHLTCVVESTRYTGNELSFSSTGWGGHSCPAGWLVVGGGVLGATESLEQGMAKSGVTVSGATYPNYPHYNFTPPEEGWVVHNGAIGQTMTVYADCIPA